MRAAQEMAGATDLEQQAIAIFGPMARKASLTVDPDRPGAVREFNSGRFVFSRMPGGVALRASFGQGAHPDGCFTVTYYRLGEGSETREEIYKNNHASRQEITADDLDEFAKADTALLGGFEVQEDD